MNKELSLFGIRFFTVGWTLDLANTYLPIPLHPFLWWYMGLTAGGRFFEYTRLPFGYKNRLHEFLRALWHIQRQVPSPLVYYTADILLLLPSLLVHQRDLELLFQELQWYGWRPNCDKCIFNQDYFNYLGVVIAPQGM